MDVIVSEGLIESVPLELIKSWEQLQTFSADLLKIKENVIDTREYLTQGAAQDGIDVYATQSGTDKLIVIQCKREKSLSPGEIDQIFDDFLSKSFVSKTAKFIICTTAELKKRKLEERIELGRQKLLEKNIDLQLWDPEGINRELRSNPQQPLVALVVRYFTPEVARRFYGDIYTVFIRELKKIAKRTYTLSENYITRGLIQHSDYYARNEFQYLSKVGEKLPLYEILRAKESGNRLMILSIGGFGKSTELKHLAGLLSKEEEPYFPIFHALIDYSGQSIEQILSLHNVEWNHVPEESIILIFDGLDEIKSKYLGDFIRQINLFADAKPKINIVVSSRFNFYDVTANPLRTFQVFVLEEFNNSDIKYYLQRIIPEKEILFYDKLNDSKLTEYIHNPYYLVRLVQLFKVDAKLFPKTKSEFFEKILFERIDEDSRRRNSLLSFTDKKHLIELVQRVAFCMTLCGKSVISNIDLEEIVPNNEDREKLRNYFLLNKHEQTQDYWAFEHKNLQEYLCASCLVKMPFDKLLLTITFRNDFKKIQPKFLNTLSFLYTLADVTRDGTFQKLFDWLLENEPDILIRFEKNRIPKDMRLTILKSIFRYYKEKGLSFFSSVLQARDIADFVEIDKQVIDFLEKELFKKDTSGHFCYDIISLLELCKTPWVYQLQLENLLLKILSENKRNRHVLADAIYALKHLGFVDLNMLKKILGTSIDKEDFHIRQSIVSSINELGDSGQYMPFLLKSVPIYVNGQTEMTYGFANETLVKAIIRSINQENIKALLQAIFNKEIGLKYPGDNHKSFINSGDFNVILQKAVSYYGTTPGIIRVVYRIFCSLKHIIHKTDWANAFKTFFIDTNTNVIIFNKLRKYRHKKTDVIILINEQVCEQLIQEYKDGKISYDEIRDWEYMIRYYTEIGDWFYKRLQDEFKYESDHIDYNDIRSEYKIKNQEMILNKELFLSEVQKIFLLIGAEVSSKNFDYSNQKLIAYETSLAYKTIQTVLHSKGKKGKYITFNEIDTIYKDDSTWQWFQIKRIKDILEQKYEIVKIELKLVANDWCKAKIENLDFDSAVSQNSTEVSINTEVYFVQKLFLLLDIQLDDYLLLRMLSSDCGYFKENSKSLSQKIINFVKDRNFAKETIIDNIRTKNLAFDVLCNHFAICAELGFVECLRDLYKFIISNNTKKSYQLQKLTDYYIVLGGDIQDFKEYIVHPVPSENEYTAYIQWNWYLIRKIAYNEPDYIRSMMIKIIEDPMMDDGQKEEACILLLQLGDIKGLVYWRTQVLDKEKLLLNAKNLSSFKVINNEAIDLLLDMLKPVYTTKLYQRLSSFDSIEDVIYEMLQTIAISSKERFLRIIDGLGILYEMFKAETYALTIANRREIIMQEFFIKNEPTLTVRDSLIVYNEIKAY